VRGMNTKQPSILISYLGFEDGIVKQDVRRIRRGEDQEQTVSLFVADKELRGEPVARIVKVQPW
jgi:hypothetical protein